MLSLEILWPSLIIKPICQTSLKFSVLTHQQNTQVLICLTLDSRKNHRRLISRRSLGMSLIFWYEGYNFEVSFIPGWCHAHIQRLFHLRQSENKMCFLIPFDCVGWRAGQTHFSLTNKLNFLLYHLDSPPKEQLCAFFTRDKIHDVLELD